MFRIRAQIPPDLLRKHITQVKTGLPGMAYVRVDPKAEWPARLQLKVPETAQGRARHMSLFMSRRTPRE